ncbi:unnamed protein product [Effrenium voratum]|nr:unnamed protein product [Effrenium voratum]
MEVKSEVEDVIQEIPDTTHRVLHPGSHAKLVGLQNTAMNGKVVQIAGFDSGRYTVKLPDGAVRKVEAAKLEETDQAPPPRISVCNVFGRHKKLKVVVQSEDASHSKAIGTLDFQACEDLKELAFEKGNVLFMMGSKEVARAAFDLPALGKGRGAELTVAPFQDDHHKARVHKNVVELDDGQAYYLHLVDAHAGPRRAKLSVQRGLTAKVLPLDKSYRLERVEDMALTLTDGAKRVKLAFKPQKARTYCAIVTGSETSDNAGLVLHKLGEWTSAGQLSDEV